MVDGEIFRKRNFHDFQMVENFFYTFSNFSRPREEDFYWRKLDFVQFRFHLFKIVQSFHFWQFKKTIAKPKGSNTIISAYQPGIIPKPNQSITILVHHGFMVIQFNFFM